MNHSAMRPPLVLLCALLLALAAQHSILAQVDNAVVVDAETPAVVNGAEPVVDVPASQSIGGMIVSGGILNVVFFGILGIFSLWAATVVLERMFNLRADKMLPGSFVKQLDQTLQSEPPDAIAMQNLCDENDVPAGRILKAGLLRTGRPVPEVEKAMEDAAAREMATLRAKSRPLSVVGNIAPLVGLLGTVVGMIMAFQISSQEGLGKAERLAEGIYLALMTTAAGLTIAIPCLLFASWFQGKGERYMNEIGDCLTKTMPSFAALEGKPLPPPVSSPDAPIAIETESDELSPREKFLNEGATAT